MSWFRLDDKFHSNPKIIAAGNAPVGLYARGGCYCADHNTDGFIPLAVAQLYGKPREIAVLLEIGLWAHADKGYVMPDYLDFNPSAQEVEERRSKRAEAGSLGGTRSGVSRRSKLEPNASQLVEDCFDSGEANTNPVPSRPLPIDKSSSQLQVRDVDNPTTTLDQRVADAINHHALGCSRGKERPGAYAATVRSNTRKEYGQALRDCASRNPEFSAAELVAVVILATAESAERLEAWYADPHCADCDGTGTVKVAEDGAGVYGPCSCRRAEPYLASVHRIDGAA